MRSGILLFLVTVTGITSAQVLDSLAMFGTGLDIDFYGNVYVVDRETNLLTVYAPGGLKPVKRFGGQGWTSEQFDGPSGIWARNGMDIFVADYGNHRVQRFDRTISFVSSLHTREDEDPEKRFGWPTDVALSRLGDLYICDTENNRILKVRESTQAEISFGGFDAGEGRLVEPEQVEIGPRDNVYVLDRNRVVVFDVFGNYLRSLGADLFRRPTDVFADENLIIVLDDDMLYRFDQHERPSAPVSLAKLSSGRFGGPDVRAMILSKGVLFLLTGRGLYLLQLPLMNPDSRQQTK